MTDQRFSYHPSSVSSPGSTLADLLDERGISQAELATRIDRPIKTISEIINAKTAITPETAIQLERALGAPARFWLAREARYREWLARCADSTRLEDDADWLDELPIKDMIRFGWIDKSRDKKVLVRLCLEYFGVASVEAWNVQYKKRIVAFRASTKTAVSAGSLATWLRQGERQAAGIVCGTFDKLKFKNILKNLRSLTLQPDPSVFIPELERECASCGVAVAFVRLPKGCPVSGATYWLNSEKAVLQLSLRYKTNDHLWFTVFHEAGHLLLHGKRAVFLESLDSNDLREREANQFAQDMLIPSDNLHHFKEVPISRDSIIQFAQSIGIAPGIVVGRMQSEYLINWNTPLNKLKLYYTWASQSSAG